MNGRAGFTRAPPRLDQVNYNQATGKERAAEERGDEGLSRYCGGGCARMELRGALIRLLYC